MSWENEGPVPWDIGHPWQIVAKTFIESGFAQNTIEMKEIQRKIQYMEGPKFSLRRGKKYETYTYLNKYERNPVEVSKSNYYLLRC